MNKLKPNRRQQLTNNTTTTANSPAAWPDENTPTLLTSCFYYAKWKITTSNTTLYGAKVLQTFGSVTNNQKTI